MRRRIAIWAWRRLVKPRVLAVLLSDRVNGYSGVYTMDEVTLVIRASGRKGRGGV
jgi:hypothetical protein